MIELLAESHADVMAVGDDDQTLYEWRGARPEYLTQRFAAVFSNKAVKRYSLSRSFRFGPLIAQAAHNCISLNESRAEKALAANDFQVHGYLYVLQQSSEQATDVNRSLCEQIISLVKQGTLARDVVVLGRMFAQLSGIEAMLLKMKVPYRVVGSAPFFSRREIQVLLGYLRAAILFAAPVTEACSEVVLSIANVPARFLPRDTLVTALESAMVSGASLGEAIGGLAAGPASKLNERQRERAQEFYECLRETRVRVEQSESAGTILGWLVGRINLAKHFDNFFGHREESSERKSAVGSFVAFASQAGMLAHELIEYVDKIDTTRGAPLDDQIVLTTVYRTKGLEYDHVFIPDCQEGFMPCLMTDQPLTFDLTNAVKEPTPSRSIESERRLFYVAITRARVGVHIGSSAPPASGRQSRSTSPMPSRFLEEIEITSLRGLVLKMQRSRTDRNKSLEAVSELTKSDARFVPLFVRNYEDVAREMGLASSTPMVGEPRTFKYRHSYTGQGPMAPLREASEPRKLHKSWDSLDMSD